MKHCDHGKKKIFQNIYSELIDSQCFSKMITKMQKFFFSIFFSRKHFLLLCAFLKKEMLEKLYVLWETIFIFIKVVCPRNLPQSIT